MSYNNPCSKEGCNGLVLSYAHQMSSEISGSNLNIVIPAGTCCRCFLDQFSRDFAFWKKEHFLHERDGKLVVNIHGVPEINWDMFARWRKSQLRDWREVHIPSGTPPHEWGECPTFKAFRFLCTLGIVSKQPSGNFLILDGHVILNPSFNASGDIAPQYELCTETFYFTRVGDAVAYARYALDQARPTVYQLTLVM